MERSRWPIVFSRFGVSRLAALAALGGLLAVALIACGGSAPAPTHAASRGAAGGMAAQSSGGAVTAAAPAARATAAATAPAGGANAGQPQNPQVPDVPKMVIKNGTLSLVVRDVDSAVNQIGGIALRHGGDVRQATNNKSGERRVADLVIQVESGQFDRAMAALREMDGVEDRTTDKTDSQDVSEEYVDVKAQIATLEATERQLRGLLEKATRTEDVLAVQREITNVRGQIDRLQGRANFLDRRAAMSTITIHLETPVAAGPGARPGEEPVAEWRLSRVAATAWDASLRVLQGVATVVVSVVVFSWWLLPLALLGWLALRVARRRTRGGAPTAAAGD